MKGLEVKKELSLHDDQSLAATSIATIEYVDAFSQRVDSSRTNPIIVQTNNMKKKRKYNSPFINKPKQVHVPKMHDLVSKSRILIRARSPAHKTEKKNKMFNKPKLKTFEFSNLVERERLKDSQSQGCLQT